jgi:ribonuclease HII
VQARAPALLDLFLEGYRLRLMRGLEERLRLLGVEIVAGVDEAGRGCLAGPVVASAVALDLRRPRLVPGVDDSKRLDAPVRERLANALRRGVAGHATVAVPAETIDRVNVLQATRLAML